MWWPGGQRGSGTEFRPFDCNRDEQAHWTAFFANEVFQGGFNALKAHFASA